MKLEPLSWIPSPAGTPATLSGDTSHFKLVILLRISKEDGKIHATVDTLKNETGNPVFDQAGFEKDGKFHSEMVQTLQGQKDLCYYLSAPGVEEYQKEILVLRYDNANDLLQKEDGKKPEQLSDHIDWWNHLEKENIHRLTDTYYFLITTPTGCSLLELLIHTGRLGWINPETRKKMEEDSRFETYNLLHGLVKQPEKPKGCFNFVTHQELMIERIHWKKILNKTPAEKIAQKLIDSNQTSWKKMRINDPEVVTALARLLAEPNSRSGKISKSKINLFDQVYLHLLESNLGLVEILEAHLNWDFLRACMTHSSRHLNPRILAKYNWFDKATDQDVVQAHISLAEGLMNLRNIEAPESRRHQLLTWKNPHSAIDPYYMRSEKGFFIREFFDQQAGNSRNPNRQTVDIPENWYNTPERWVEMRKNLLFNRHAAGSSQHHLLEIVPLTDPILQRVLQDEEFPTGVKAGLAERLSSLI